MNATIGIPLLAIILVGTLLYVIRRVPEKSATLTAVGIGMTFIIGMTFVLLVPSFNSNWSVNTGEKLALYHAVYSRSAIAQAEAAHLPVPPPLTVEEVNAKQQSDPADLVGYTPEQARGRLVYQREGCLYCHSQQIRPLDGEIKRYSLGSTGASLAPVADEREYVWDQPHFLGTRRIGPDLSREGGKYSDDWHYSHFYYPRQMVPGSIMPAFTWLFTKDPTDASAPPMPNADARALVAYVQTLGFNRQIWYQPMKRDPKTGQFLKDAHGNFIPDGAPYWRRWLDPADQLQTQSIGEGQVLRADTSAGNGKGGQVRGGDVQSPSNRIAPKPPVKQ